MPKALFLIVTTLSLLLTSCLTPSVSAENPSDAEPSPEAESSNLVSNGDFSMGGDGWAVISNPATGANYDDVGVREGRYCVVVSDGGDSPWDVYLYTGNVPLEAGVTYVLQFDAATEVVGTASFSVKVGQSSPPYAAYGYETFSVTGNENASSELVFIADSSDGAAQIEFQLGGQSQTQEFCLDNVVLTASAPGGS